jgi:phthiocerol/phenolphthiocerol synthesis type-I polyketide synthase E
MRVRGAKEKGTVTGSIFTGEQMAYAPARAEGKTAATSGMPQLLVLSGDSEHDLDQVTTEVTESLAAVPASSLEEMARSLRSRRAGAYRRMLVSSSRDDALVALRARDPKRLLSSRPQASAGPTVFLLPGIGDQYVGMAHDLYLHWEVFRRAVDRCAELFERHLGRDIRALLYPSGDSWKRTARAQGYDMKSMLGRGTDAPEDADTAALNRTLFAQPALFTLEFALTRLWQSLGVEPDAMVCHSLGEYVGACISGVISLDDAVSLVALRAKLVESLPQMAMLSVLSSEREIQPLLPADVALSLINGPQLCVVAGPPPAVAELAQTLAARDITTVPVRSSHAFHSCHMLPIAAEFEAHARTIRASAPRIPYTSNVTGRWITREDTDDPGYWVKHLTRTARFSDALSLLWSLQSPVLVECGPGRTLAVLAGQHPDRQVAAVRNAVLPLRQRYENAADQQVFLTAVGKAWLAGLPVFRQGMQEVDSTQTSADSAAATRRSPEQRETAEATPAASASAAYIAPRNDLELSLTRACERVLGLPRVGITDNFFELGGHSLAVIKLITEMKQTAGLDIDLGEVFRTPTVAQLVESLGTAARKKVSIVVPLQPKGQKPPIFCICGIDLYKGFAVGLDEDQPVYGVYVPEEQAIIANVLQGSSSGLSIQRLVEAYYEAIVRFQPEGPYRLAGVSFGGLLAIALASKMRQNSAAVEMVFLFDTILPEGRRRIWRKWLLAHMKELASHRGPELLRRDFSRVRRKLFPGSAREQPASGTTQPPMADDRDRANFYQQFAEQQRAAFRGAYVQWNPDQSKLDFPVVLFRASIQDVGPGDVIEEDYGWGRYVGRSLSIVDVRGGHVSMLREPYVGDLARCARDWLPA